MWESASAPKIVEATASATTAHNLKGRADEVMDGFRTLNRIRQLSRAVKGTFGRNDGSVRLLDLRDQLSNPNSWAA